MVGRMSGGLPGTHDPHDRGWASPLGRYLVVWTALVGLAGAACVAGTRSPIPGPQSPPGSLQLSRFKSGSAKVHVAGVIERTLVFPLQPSAVQGSPPPLLDLAYGDAATGEGVTLQLPPEEGTTRSSASSILTLDVRLGARGTLQATAMDGECSITLDRVSRMHVSGRFACRGLHQNVGSGPTVSATGSFTARG